MNPKYQITIAWSQEDECYLAYLPDFANEIMQPVSHGDTYQEALQHGLYQFLKIRLQMSDNFSSRVV